MTQPASQGWAETTLERLASITGGVTKNSSKKAGMPYPYLRVANVYADELRLEDVTDIRVGEAELDRVLLRRGDLLVVEGNGSVDQIGRVALWDGSIDPCVHQNHLIKVRCDDESLPRFLLYWLLSPEGREAVVRVASSTSGLHTLSLSKVSALPVRLAPDQTRRAIVEALDSYLSRLDDVVATLERVQRNLKRYRASVLKAAVEGRLVLTEAELAREEGRDYEPADALLVRILEERRSRWIEDAAEQARAKAERKAKAAGKPWTKTDDQAALEKGRKAAAKKYTEPEPPDTSELPELPEGWSWASMDQFLVTIQAGKNFRCIERPPHEGEVGVVKVSAVTWGTFDPVESKTCPAADLLNAAHLIREGDFLISRANTIELVGACVIAGSFSQRLMLSDKILRLVTVGDLDWWLLAVLRSGLGRTQIERLATGNQESMRNISQGNIKRIAIPLPPRGEALRAIEEWRRQTSSIDHSEGVVTTNRRRAERLRHSILKWAFEGRLVDQDPDDEPASVLLERIKAEREKASAPNGKKKRGRSPRKKKTTA